ncbi:MAG: GerMN domain-containing protein [Acidimicrobiales bacterium]
MSLLLAACSVGTTASPQIIPPHNVPFGLLNPAPTTTLPRTSTVRVTILFEGAQHLVTVNRAVPAPGTIRAVLAALGRGPTSTEAADNLQSPISTAAPLSLKSVDGTTAVVDVGSSFSALSGADQIVAAAQLVYTLALFPGIDQVSIRVGDQPTRMPTATGKLSSGPLTRSAYASLAPL